MSSPDNFKIERTMDAEKYEVMLRISAKLVLRHIWWRALSDSKSTVMKFTKPLHSPGQKWEVWYLGFH